MDDHSDPKTPSNRKRPRTNNVSIYDVENPNRTD